MTPIAKLARPARPRGRARALRDEPATWFTARDEIKAIIAQRIADTDGRAWLAVLEPADIWCAKVLDWPELMEHDGFRCSTCCRP